MFNRVQHPDTLEFVAPVAGVMFRSQGYCGNKHFATLELAQANFEQQLAELKIAYANVKSTANYRITETPANNTTIRRIEIVNVKKNGEPGKIKNSLRLYTIS